MALTGPHHGIFQVRVHGNGQVAGQGPGGGGPDGQQQRGRQLHAPGLRIRHREGHGDGGAGLIGVLHLGLGQGRAGAVAPVDDLELAGDRSALEQLGQVAHGLGLIEGIHGHVGMLPGTQDAEALEGRALGIDPLLGIGAAALEELGAAQLPALGAQVLLHGVLDGQAVAVPARHVGRLVALHPAGLHHHVLEDLVQRMAHVDGAIGIGWPVVQDLAAPALPGGVISLPLGLDAGIEALGLPALQALRLPLR